ncbi:3145_t:CDS:1, partial [Paraglomus brasilianum]
MPPKSKTTLTDSQKYELCRLYARDNKKSRTEYVNWIENKWQVESTITRILQRSNQLLFEEEIIAPNAKRHRSVTYPELEQQPSVP